MVISHYQSLPVLWQQRPAQQGRVSRLDLQLVQQSLSWQPHGVDHLLVRGAADRAVGNAIGTTIGVALDGPDNIDSDHHPGHLGSNTVTDQCPRDLASDAWPYRRSQYYRP